MCVCVSADMYRCECRRLRSPEEKVGSPGAGVTGSYEQHMMLEHELRSSGRIVLSLSC